MRWKPFSLLLALLLFLTAGLEARADNQPYLIWEAGSRAGTISVDLENLNSSAYGVQVELTLEGKYPDCKFTADNTKAYSPGCTTVLEGGQTTVTIYLTSREALNSKSYVPLGTLDLGTQEAVKEDVVSKRADVTLLDRGLTGRTVKDIAVIGSSGGTGSNPGGSVWEPVQPEETNRPSTPSTTKPSSGSTGNKPTTSRPSDSTDTTSNPTLPSTPDIPDSPDNAGPTLPGQDNLPSISTTVLFSDVLAGDWFREAVEYVSSRGMMNGTGADTFAPYATTTRAMIVTILHRLEGSPAAVASAFHDVPSSEYYALPVAWASEQGIVTGYSESIFHPNTPITREQLAAILYRYAQYRNVDVSGKNDLTQFSDTAEVSSYAKDAFAWAVEANIITGIGSALDPAGSANRAQVATILMRLCTNVLDN